jgi:flagellar biosynthesis protein FlhB
MADKPASERTEQPTSKRLEKAREKGQVPHSQELDSFASIIVLVLAAFFLAGAFNKWCIKEIIDGVSCDTHMFANSESFASYTNGKIVSVILVMLPFLASLAIASVVANFLIGGMTFTFGAIELKLDAINPVSGMSNLINMKSMVNFLLSIAKLAFVGMIVWWYLRSRVNEFMLLRWAWSAEMMSAMGKLIFGLLIRMCVGLLIIGLIDVFYQKWKYIDDMKMTKQEVNRNRKKRKALLK